LTYRYLSGAGLIAALAATAVLVARPALPASDLRQSPAAAPTIVASPTSNVCAWHYGAIGKRRFGNSDFIDSAVTYLVTPFKNKPRSTLRIRGTFPYARYISFSTYSGKSMTFIDGITDQAIVPDRGSSNPFVPAADRGTRRRSYTLTVRPGTAPAHGRPANSLYGGASGTVYLMYRIYAPDKGVDTLGGVPKPHIDVIEETAPGDRTVVSLPACTPLRPVQATFREWIPTPMIWHALPGMGKGGANPDDGYLQARLDQQRSTVYVVRFKAPRVADTYHGHTITGREDVRYWSLCMYVMVTSKLVGCLHDYQALRDAAGYVTVVVSTYAHKPHAATRANGVNWLPFGPERIGMLTYRQLLPRAAFRGDIKGLTMNASQQAMRAKLGSYVPTIRLCAVATYSLGRCS
jgi:hypothetical protein